MTFKTYLSVFGSDDKKHDLERKFGYKYRALESVYPNADKLPDDEIKKAIDVFYDVDANENVETMLNRVKDYTTKNEPIWKEKYFNPKPKFMQTSVSQPQEPNLMQKPKLKGFGDYMADVKQIGNRIWENAHHLPRYESGYLVGMVKPAFDHWKNMDNKNFFEIGKQVKDISKDVIKYYPLGLNDKYKHAVINCRAAQRGQTAEDLVTYFADRVQKDMRHKRG